MFNDEISERVSKSNYKRQIAWSVIAILMIVIAVWLGKRIVKANEKTPQKVEKTKTKVSTITVKNKTVNSIITASGVLTAKKRLALFSEVQGVFLLRNKLFRAGQRYAKGETIISINAAEFRANVLARRSNLFTQIAAIMPDLKLDYPEAYPQWSAYLKTFEVEKTLRPFPEITSDRVRYFLAAKNLTSSYYEIKNLETRLTKYRITAPFDGVVTEALVTEGSLIIPNQKLGTFIKTGTYELAAAIAKEYGDLVNIGTEVALLNTSKNQKYKGVITRINSSIQSNSQTLQCFIEVQNSALKEGMYLEAAINARKIENAVEVNRSLLQNKNQLFIVKDGALALETVKPVHFTDQKVIVQGLEDGATLVDKPILGAYPGMLVELDNTGQ